MSQQHVAGTVCEGYEDTVLGYSNRRARQMLVSEYWLGQTSRRLLLQPLTQAGRAAGYPSLHPVSCRQEAFWKFDMTYCHVAPADKGICFLDTYILLLSHHFPLFLSDTRLKNTFSHIAYVVLVIFFSPVKALCHEPPGRHISVKNF